MLDLLNDFSDDSPWELVERVAEFVNSVSGQNGWTIAYGNFATQSANTGDVVFVARCFSTRVGVKWLCVIRGAWRCGKIAYV